MTLVELLRDGRWSAETCLSAADRIEELEAKLARYENQEPVGWLQNKSVIVDGLWEIYSHINTVGDGIPLYTNKIGEQE